MARSVFGRRRIASSPGSRRDWSWPAAGCSVPGQRCAAARAGLPASTLILRGDQHAPGQLADLVLDALR